MNKYPVWLDCDVGVDDAIAIMALHALEETDLLAISTVSGNVPLSSTFFNAHRAPAFPPLPARQAFSAVRRSPE